jgi:hypothetical protein
MSWGYTYQFLENIIVSHSEGNIASILLKVFLRRHLYIYLTCRGLPHLQHFKIIKKKFFQYVTPLVTNPEFHEV